MNIQSSYQMLLAIGWDGPWMNGDKEQAQTTWQAIVTKSPDTYYGILSEIALQQKSSTNSAFLLEMEAVAGPPSQLEGDDGSQVFAEKWLNLGAMTKEHLGVLSDTVAIDADLLQGKRLLLKWIGVTRGCSI